MNNSHLTFPLNWCYSENWQPSIWFPLNSVNWLLQMVLDLMFTFKCCSFEKNQITCTQLGAIHFTNVISLMPSVLSITCWPVLHTHLILPHNCYTDFVLVVVFMSTLWVPKCRSTENWGFWPYKLNPVGVPLVQLYACTKVSTMSLQLDIVFGGKVPSIFINV